MMDIDEMKKLYLLAIKDARATNPGLIYEDLLKVGFSAVPEFGAKYKIFQESGKNGITKKSDMTEDEALGSWIQTMTATLGKGGRRKNGNGNGHHIPEKYRTAIKGMPNVLRVEYVPIGSIHPSDFNPPSRTERHSLILLLRSIKENGILNPITVTRNGQIADGHRRYECAKQLGMTHVPVIYRVEDAETLFSEMNGSMKNITRKAWTDAARRGLGVDKLPSLTQSYVIELQRILGDDFYQLDFSATVYPGARQVANYIGDLSDEMLRRIIFWFMNNPGMQNVSSNAIRNGIKPSVIAQAIENNKPIQMSWWA